MVKINFDGGKKKGGGITFGFVAKDEEGNVLKKWGNSFNDKKLTTNDAEYQGLEEALLWAIRENIRDVQIFSDSLLCVSQVNGKYQVKAKNLKIRHERISGLRTHFDAFSITWTRRENNSEADAVCKDYRGD